MAAPKGNQFWKVRSSHGRKPKFEAPEILWSACQEYFQWVAENPLLEAEVVKFQGEATLTDVPRMRAMTISGLCIFLDIDRTTWDKYRNRQGYSNIVTRAEEVIRTQKFEGAAAELLSSNIIARDLGLVDKKQTSNKRDLETLSDEELERELKALRNAQEERESLKEGE